MFLAVLILLLSAVPGAAQVDRATLGGTVSDSSEAVVPGAKVVLVSQETGLRREAQTGPNGAYVFSLVPIGVYTVTATQAGLRTVTMKDLRLGVGDNRTLNIQMEVSTIQTSITVESILAPMESTSAVVGTVIGGQHMRDIPLNGRHWASLMALAPGAINTGEGNQQSIRFVGRARDDNNWTFDGLDATGVKDPRQEAALRLVISTDSIAEFRVNSTLYSAESGSGAGGQVNLVSKSGSNEFHGSVFEFFRNDHMDARNPFDTAKQPFRLNQFGGSAGGPILKNRTFFFANYEGLRQR
ncbi:MAG: TonB-dependent receptor, partial [Bryobacterales bacterium]|nr:TonB-dependent receptor [Bryobacterales bacterium]